MASFDPIETVGVVAAVFTTSSFVPQAVRLLVRKDTAAISLTTYVVFAIGIALWLAYGVAIARWPIIIANVITLVLVFAIIAAKLRYG
jgi:MtN3 and saliva related transmembrane protein